MTKRVLLWLVGLGPAVAALLASRKVAQSTILTDDRTYSGWRLLAVQTLTVALLGFSLIAIHQALRHRFPERTGRALAFSAAALLTGPIVSAAIGGHGGPWPRLLATPLVFIAFYLSPRVPMEGLITDIRRIMRIYMWGSLLSLLVAPDWAQYSPLESVADGNGIRDYLGLGAGRLLGLTGHPNIMGAIAVASLALEIAPIARRRWWLLHASAAAGVMLLTESRTAWCCAIALVLIRPNPFRAGVRPGVLYAFGGVVVCAVALLLPGVQQMLADDLSRPEISSLNGRTRAWGYALAEFWKNPLFGYGPTIFSPDYRKEVIHDPSMTWVGQAHNQVMQTMGAYGLFGLAGLATFFVVILAVGAGMARRSAGLLLVLPIMIVIRSLTESPLEVSGGATGSLTLVAFTWLLLLSALDERSAEQALASRGTGQTSTASAKSDGFGPEVVAGGQRLAEQGCQANVLAAGDSRRWPRKSRAARSAGWRQV